MKKRITCMLLALCMVLAAVPAAVATPVVEDQINLLQGSAQMEKHQISDIKGIETRAIEKSGLTTLNSTEYATYMLHTASLGQTCLVGSDLFLSAIAYVPNKSIIQNWNVDIFEGNEITEDGFVCGYYGTFGGEYDFYEINSIIKTEEKGMKAGTYLVVYYSSYGAGKDLEIIQDTMKMSYVYLTNTELPMKRSFFSDASVPGYPEVKKICVARGFNGVTSYFLRFDPERTTDYRFGQYCSPNIDMLEAESFGGFLMLNAKVYCTLEVLADGGGNGLTISVEVCTDDQGHDYEKVVSQEPTCTEEGHYFNKCAKCGYSVSGSSIPALGHSWDAGTITKEETEEAWGEKLYACTRCGATKTAFYHTCPGAIFKDMPTDDNWSHRGIDYCVKNQLMNGMGNNLFQPFGNTTRAQLITVLWRMAGAPEPESEAPFVDLVEGSFFEKAVKWGYENGIVKGISETKFSPSSLVTREQMATFFYRYADKILKADVSDRMKLETFPDNDRISDYSVDCLSWACAVGLINGVPNGSVTYLQPKSGATRAQIATVLMRFCENIVPEIPETPEVPEVPEA